MAEHVFYVVNNLYLLTCMTYKWQKLWKLIYLEQLKCLLDGPSCVYKNWWWKEPAVVFFRNRAARVDDYIETLQSIHKNFNLPYPAVNQISSSFPFSPKAYRQGKVSSSLTFQQSYHFFQTVIIYSNNYYSWLKEFLLE